MSLFGKCASRSINVVIVWSCLERSAKPGDKLKTGISATEVSVTSRWHHFGVNLNWRQVPSGKHIDVKLITNSKLKHYFKKKHKFKSIIPDQNVSSMFIHAFGLIPIFCMSPVLAKTFRSLQKITTGCTFYTKNMRVDRQCGSRPNEMHFLKKIRIIHTKHDKYAENTFYPIFAKSPVGDSVPLTEVRKIGYVLQNCFLQ